MSDLATARSVIMAELEDGVTSDVTILARYTVDMLHNRDPWEVLEEVMPTYVREIIHQHRRKVGIVLDATPQPEVRRASNPSRKVQAYQRKGYEDKLNAIYTGEGGIQKRLRDFTYGDLIALSTECYDQAAKMQAKGGFWRALASTLESDGARTLGGMRAETLEKVLG